MGFKTYTAAHHRGAIKLFALYFRDLSCCPLKTINSSGLLCSAFFKRVHQLLPLFLWLQTSIRCLNIIVYIFSKWYIMNPRSGDIKPERIPSQIAVIIQHPAGHMGQNSEVHLKSLTRSLCSYMISLHRIGEVSNCV